MIFFLKKIYYSIFNKNYNFTKTLINQYYSNKKKTVISLSSIGKGTKYIQKEEFFKLTNNYNLLFIRDTSRSWFNNLDLKLLKSNLKRCKPDFAIGFSMGGFNAIILSTLYKIKKVIAVSPQFSIHPRISKDKTFLNYASRIQKWKYPQLKFSKNTDYLLFFGDTSTETYHASLIPKKKNIRIIVIKNSDHETLGRFKGTRKFYKLIIKFFEQ